MFVRQWQAVTITLVEKVQIIAVFLGSLFLVASISWLLWSALSPQAIWQRRDVLFQICYGMYGFMDLVCIGEFRQRWMLLKVSLSLIIGCKIQVEPPKQRLPVQVELNKILWIKFFTCNLKLCLVFCPRPDCPRGGSSVQRLPALARREPALGRSELRQGQGHGGGQRRSLLAGPQDALVAPGQCQARRVLTGHPAGVAVVDPPVFGLILPQIAAQNQPGPGKRLRRGCHSHNFGVRGHLACFSWCIVGFYTFSWFNYFPPRCGGICLLWGRSSNVHT